jgi:ABC-type multidrug transport system fused ATPase/permease subunit
MGVQQPLAPTLSGLPANRQDRSAALPPTLSRYIWRHTASHQIALAAIAVVVFLLSAVPLELQRRIVNDAIANGAISTILALAGAYIAVAVTEGAIKLCLNIYRGWVSETAVRHIRRMISVQIGHASHLLHTAKAEGIEISMILSEAEPVGGFVGISVSEPLLHGGVLATVFGYMIYVQPQMAFLCAVVLTPQLIFVPLLQRAINRRAAARIRVLREVSGGIIDHGHAPSIARQERRIDRVFLLNMGIYKLKFSMNFLMNAMHHFSVAATLGIGGWYAVTGRADVGTVVAFVSGLVKINDPWGDVVNWFREMTVSRVKYRLIAEASEWLECCRRGVGCTPPAA